MARKKKQAVFEPHNRLHLQQGEMLEFMNLIVPMKNYISDKVETNSQAEIVDGCMILKYKANKVLNGKNNKKDTIQNFNEIVFTFKKEIGNLQGNEEQVIMYSVTTTMTDATIKQYRKRKTTELKPSKQTIQKQNISDIYFDFQNSMIEIKEILQGLH